MSPNDDDGTVGRHAQTVGGRCEAIPKVTGRRLSRSASRSPYHRTGVVYKKKTSQMVVQDLGRRHRERFPARVAIPMTTLPATAPADAPSSLEPQIPRTSPLMPSFCFAFRIIGRLLGRGEKGGGKRKKKRKRRWCCETKQQPMPRKRAAGPRDRKKDAGIPASSKPDPPSQLAYSGSRTRAGSQDSLGLKKLRQVCESSRQTCHAPPSVPSLQLMRADLDTSTRSHDFG